MGAVAPGEGGFGGFCELPDRHKPVVCAVQGMCTAGALYFVNEADVVISSLTGGSGKLVLKENDRTIAERAITFPAGKSRYTFPIFLRSAGYYEYSVTVVVEQGDDSWKENNTVLNYLFVEGEGKVLVVTDDTLVETGAVGAVQNSFERVGAEVEVFAGGEPEPSIQVAEAAAEVARSLQPDAVIGIGGGSNMDLAKCVAALFTHGGSPVDYFGYDKVPGPVLPILCVPTTAGTGSEVSHSAVLTDLENEMKVSMLSNFLRPLVAVVDPTNVPSSRVAQNAGFVWEGMTTLEGQRVKVYRRHRYREVRSC